jgi:hypothetical protein
MGQDEARPQSRTRAIVRLWANDRRERSPWVPLEEHAPNGVFAKPYPTDSKRADDGPVARLSNLTCAAGHSLVLRMSPSSLAAGQGLSKSNTYWASAHTGHIDLHMPDHCVPSSFCRSLNPLLCYHYQIPRLI